MEDTGQASYTASRNFEFTGSGAEYFRIWIVNIALTILTLGIFSAWAKVRRLRYFYGHTWLDGHNFAYLADPVKILKGRLLAVALLVLYSVGTSLRPDLAVYILVAALLLVPFVIVTSSAFRLRNSAYRNLRFGFVPTVLLQTSYSRGMESEADDFAVANAGAGGVEPRDLADMLTRLDRHHRTCRRVERREGPIAADECMTGNDVGDDDRADGDWTSYASTHPAIAERIARIRAASR